MEGEEGRIQEESKSHRQEIPRDVLNLDASWMVELAYGHLSVFISNSCGYMELKRFEFQLRLPSHLLFCGVQCPVK